MKIPSIFLFLVLFIIVSTNSSPAYDSTENPQPLAVVELFASEGCSSCPPADELLSELTRLATTQGMRVFTLSFQVDYWDYLGWKDPYSKHEYTQRQYQYSKVLESSSVYTPQMVVNGKYGFVGSQSDLVRKYIDRVLGEKVSNEITLQVKNDGNNIQVAYSLKELVPDSVLNLALVERGLESNVTAGENRGRLLKHDNIVREFKTIPLKEKEGIISLDVSAVVDPSQSSIISYLQNSSDMKVLAAQSIDLQ